MFNNYRLCVLTSQADGKYGRRMRRAMRGELRASDRYVRAMNYMELAVRRRSHAVRGGVKRHLAPVR